MKIAIVGYADERVGKWDETDVSKGLPGSEECVVYGTIEMARIGHEVDIFMNPKTEHKNMGVNWYNISKLNLMLRKKKYDVAILWRRLDPNVLNGKCRKVLSWLHDSPYNPSGYNFPNFSGILILSKHHQEQYTQAYKNYSKIPHVICGNGYVDMQFLDKNVAKNKYSVGYYSNYSRGLNILLKIWPKIREAYPEATLDIYYGREVWGACSREELDRIISDIIKLKDSGVIEHGMVGHQELAKGMMSNSIWAYPCTTATETFCITAVKCQAAGCIPVTTRIGALAETVSQDAFTIDNITTWADVDRYRDLLLSVMEKVDTIDRSKYITFAKQYNWEECVSKIETFWKGL